MYKYCSVTIFINGIYVVEVIAINCILYDSTDLLFPIFDLDD